MPLILPQKAMPGKMPVPVKAPPPPAPVEPAVTLGSVQHLNEERYIMEQLGLPAIRAPVDGDFSMPLNMGSAAFRAGNARLVPIGQRVPVPTQYTLEFEIATGHEWYEVPGTVISRKNWLWGNFAKEEPGIGTHDLSADGGILHGYPPGMFGIGFPPADVQVRGNSCLQCTPEFIWNQARGRMDWVQVGITSGIRYRWDARSFY